MQSTWQSVNCNWIRLDAEKRDEGNEKKKEKERERKRETKGVPVGRRFVRAHTVKRLPREIVFVLCVRIIRTVCAVSRGSDQLGPYI